MFGSPRRRALWSLLVVFGMLVAACGGGDTSTSTAAPATADDGGATADTLIAPTASGGQLDINELRGTPTMLWFWAPW